jgi:hypothetical protein
MFALRAGPPQTVTFCAAHKKRQFAPAHAAGVRKGKVFLYAQGLICHIAKEGNRVSPTT